MNMCALKNHNDMESVKVLYAPERGSWSATRAYSNPGEYRYFSYKLLQLRLREHALRYAGSWCTA
jgi:hypothetical protein